MSSINPNVDSWVTEYESCERLSNSLQLQIAQRDRESKLSPAYTKISADIRLSLKDFTTNIEQLKNKLNLSGLFGNITTDELERRQRQIENLQSRLQTLQNKFRNAPDTSERNNLFPSSGASKLWEDESSEDEPPAISHTNVNVEDLRKQQIRILEEQNDGLEVLSKTISRQKDLASRLGQEVEEQNDILDNLADNLERVDTGVNSATRFIGVVTQKDKTCGYWIVIIALFVAILIVSTVL